MPSTTYNIDNANDTGTEFDFQWLGAILDRPNIFIVKIPGRIKSDEQIVKKIKLPYMRSS
jgi:hypothetical protein